MIFCIRFWAMILVPAILFGCSKGGKDDLNQKPTTEKQQAVEAKPASLSEDVGEKNLGCADAQRNNFLMTVSSVVGQIKVSSLRGTWVFDRKVGIFPPPADGLVSEVSGFQSDDGQFGLMLSYFDPGRGATMKPDDVMVSIVKLTPDNRGPGEVLMNGVCFETGLALKKYLESRGEGLLKNI